MKCIQENCETLMDFIECGDNPNEGYAFNVYFCQICDILVKEDVWKNAGLTILYPDGRIEKA